MIDRYTKTILTVIAAALVALAVQNALPSARAAGGVQKVVICNKDGTRCADVSVGELQVDTD